jgi:hypothetical protein
VRVSPSDIDLLGMEVIAMNEDKVGWASVLRDVLEFQVKLVIDGIKDLALAQVALGAAVIDLILRDGSPGRRFYGIVSVSDRFDRWLQLHAVAERAPADSETALRRV